MLKEIGIVLLLISGLTQLSLSGKIDNSEIELFLKALPLFQPYPEFSRKALYFRYPNFDNWQRPNMPITVGIQIGHWLKNQNVPPELHALNPNRLKEISGARYKNFREVDINYRVGLEVKKFLEQKGIKVDLLGAIIPPNYYADAFVALHANVANPKTSGFMITGPLIDYSKKAEKLKQAIIKHYSKTTGLNYLPRVTKRMTYYYAFNWSKFKHSIHPKTPAVILEMGHMTNLYDMLFLLLAPEKIGEGIAKGILEFLKEEYNVQ